MTYKEKMRTKRFKCKLCQNLISLRTLDKTGLCKSCCNKTIKLGKNNPQWAGNNVSYGALHSWLRRTFGKANKCEGKNCTGKSKDFDWACINKNYERNRKSFRMLCSSCHIKEHRKPGEWTPGYLKRQRNKKGQFV